MCKVLILARHSIGYTYTYSLFNIFVFRSFLVLLADLGLVKGGQADLRLFNQLFWLVVAVNLVLSFFTFPIVPTIRGTFPSQTLIGKVCLLSGFEEERPLENSEEIQAAVFVKVALNFLGAVLVIYFVFKVKTFLARFCPLGKMYCIGAYQRNVITWKRTALWYFLWFMITNIDIAFKSFLLRSPTSVSSRNLFLIWNAYEFILVEGLHSILPLALQIPAEKRDSKKNVNFYTRTPVSFEPRRP